MDKMINATVGRFVKEMAQKHPDSECLIYRNRDIRYTYKEFNEVCDKTAKGFLKLGIGKGDNVAIWATNYPEWIIGAFSLMKIGAIVVTVNTNYKIYEAEYLLRQSDSKALILIDGFKDSNYVEIINTLCPELKDCEKGNLHSKRLPRLRTVISIENEHEGMYNFSDLIELGSDIPDSVLEGIEKELDPHEVINIQYTSGTTGFPKGVMLTHYNILNNGFNIGECMKFTEKDKLCIPVPFFHCFGLVLAIMACVTHGTAMAPIYAYRPTEVLEVIEKERCTAVHGVPTMFILMLEHEDFGKYDLSSLRTGIMAGSPCPITAMREVVDRMNMREITIAYGQTEASPVITQTTTDDPLEVRVATVGKELPGIEVKIVDPETGKEVGNNVKGELCARGYSIMKGYYNMPEATEAAIDSDNFLHTGDLAYRDDDGYYHISGRIKDMIIRGGENIYPREIEEMLYLHESISDVQVVGIPSKEYGEEIIAYIILKEGCNLTEEDVKKYVLANMARHKVPRFVEFVTEFPLTASGKIQKFKLREMAVEKYNLQDAAAIETA